MKNNKLKNIPIGPNVDINIKLIPAIAIPININVEHMIIF